MPMIRFYTLFQFADNHINYLSLPTEDSYEKWMDSELNSFFKNIELTPSVDITKLVESICQTLP